MRIPEERIPVEGIETIRTKAVGGGYHYHCGGHPAHLHENGICPYDPKDKISINDAPSKMYVGDMNQLTWSVKAYSGSDWVDWESSDESVVTVSDSGELKAVAPGKARITATLLNGENLSILRSPTGRLRRSVSYPHRMSLLWGTFFPFRRRYLRQTPRISGLNGRRITKT